MWVSKVWRRGSLFNYYGKPVGFYFKPNTGPERFELRSKYDGETLCEFFSEQIKEILEK